MVAHVPWPHALRSLVVPELQWNAAYATALVAILGTTISPYLFFWQAGQEIEEQRRHHIKPLCIAPRNAGPEFARIRIDTLTGMAFSTLVSLAIVFATAATLHANGIRDIATSQQAAEALRPIAGEFAFATFAVGIIGTGLLQYPCWRAPPHMRLLRWRASRQPRCQTAWRPAILCDNRSHDAGGRCTERSWN